MRFQHRMPSLSERNVMRALFPSSATSLFVHSFLLCRILNKCYFETPTFYYNLQISLPKSFISMAIVEVTTLIIPINACYYLGLHNTITIY